MRLFGKRNRRRPQRAGAAPARVRLEVESLEARIVPYALANAAWPQPALVTISFVPDGTLVGTNAQGYVYSNLFAKMNAKFGSPSVWENEILRAAQSWAVQTNLNFDIVADNGTSIGQGAYQQGDPNMGDIRVSGYGFSTNYLATAASPPPVNNYSIAGDIQFNTNDNWHIGTTYDLFTVAAHEMGHALGMLHSSYNTAVMYASYFGVKSSLTSDDIAGIRANYSGGNPRTADPTNNNTIATATDISSLIDPNLLTGITPDTDLSSAGDTDYYTFTTPQSSGSTLTVGVQSKGLSMLTPALTVYASDGVTVLGSASDAGHLGGNTLTVSVSGVTGGEQFYVKVAGADSSVFSVGEYALTVNLGSNATPVAPTPDTPLANGSPTHGGGGQMELGWAAKQVSTSLGTTRDFAANVLNGSADINPATPQADGALGQLLAQGNANPAQAGRPTIIIPSAAFLPAQPTANLWISPSLSAPASSLPTLETQPAAQTDWLKAALTRVFAQADDQANADDNGSADAVAPTDAGTAATVDSPTAAPEALDIADGLGDL